MSKDRNIIRSGNQETSTPDADTDILVDVQKAMQGQRISSEIDVPVGNADEAIASAAFNHDILDVVFSQPRDKNDFKTARVGWNGVLYEYPRNNTVCKVPRGVVEILARSRLQNVETKLVKAEDGADQYVPTINEAHTYPFSVIVDPRGAKGHQWLQKILHEKLH
jgi:hypothetical protein